MGAWESKTDNEGIRHDVWTVLPHHMGGGPHGLGDPYDDSLRNVEIEVVIPQRMRDRAKEKCGTEVAAFSKCGKEMGLLLPFRCRKENDALKSCMVSWYQNKEFEEEIKKEYLEERSQYRLTGIPKKHYQRHKT